MRIVAGKKSSWLVSLNFFHHSTEQSKYKHSPMTVKGLTIGIFTILPALLPLLIASHLNHGCPVHQSKYSLAASHSQSGEANSISRPCLLLSFQNLFPIGAAMAHVYYKIENRKALPFTIELSFIEISGLEPFNLVIYIQEVKPKKFTLRKLKRFTWLITLNIPDTIIIANSQIERDWRWNIPHGFWGYKL
jgi:hypothetical protein